MKKRRIVLLSMIIGVSIIIGACAPMRASQDAYYESPAMEGGFDGASAPVASEMEEAVDKDRGFDTGAGESASAMMRMVIYNADLRIAVENPETAMKAVIQMAENAGGFVVYSNVTKTFSERGSLPRASLTIRVPSGQLNSIMESIKGLTPNPREDVISENVSGQDVTAEFTDLESRLRNLEAAEQALVALMEEAQDPQDVLDIFGELTYYRGEIEIVKGRMRYISESVALSAISVEIVAKASIQPLEIAGWEPRGTVKSAIESLIEAAQILVDILIWFGIFCLPFLIPLGVGVYFLVRVIKKRRAKKKAAKGEEIVNS